MGKKRWLNLMNFDSILVGWSIWETFFLELSRIFSRNVCVCVCLVTMTIEEFMIHHHHDYGQHQLPPSEKKVNQTDQPKNGSIHFVVFGILLEYFFLLFWFIGFWIIQSLPIFDWKKKLTNLKLNFDRLIDFDK